ncbi:MAG: 50S ribosomal protein L2 [Candidatus Altiarchaeales archaeon IMC4]|nr:ribosomal protein L2 [uncultured archaeon]ODS42822.1 MAG: 50S ribosomal protein L2 [Candidatus Altiarchaeales archaeon IMC4]
MGSKLIAQRRGAGTPRYRSPGHRFKSAARYPNYKKTVMGQVIDIINDPGRSAPLVKLLMENFEEVMIIAPEGIRVGQHLFIGPKAEAKTGNVLQIGKIPEGTQVYNLEKEYFDGGKLVRASGTSASIVSHEPDKNITYVKMPSRRIMTIDSGARATIGRVAGGGRTEKPMIHAGQLHFKKLARTKLYPKVDGMAMNARDHPHGGGGSIGRQTSISRNAPRGRKVGHISPKRTGLRKK